MVVVVLGLGREGPGEEKNTDIFMAFFLQNLLSIIYVVNCPQGKEDALSMPGSPLRAVRLEYWLNL